MKKILLIFVATLFFSCSTDEERVTESQNDCDCDRVVEVNYFNVAGNPMNYYCIYFTINDCTQVQRRKEYTTIYQSTLPQIGQCR